MPTKRPKPIILGQQQSIPDINESQVDLLAINEQDDQILLDAPPQNPSEIIQIQKEPNEMESKYILGFKNSEVIHTDRETLPYLQPLGYTVQAWKVIAKVVQQDMTRVSLPVMVAEPLNALQRSAELMSNWRIVEELQRSINDKEGNKDPSNASCKRLALCGML